MLLFMLFRLMIHSFVAVESPLKEAREGMENIERISSKLADMEMDFSAYHYTALATIFVLISLGTMAIALGTFDIATRKHQKSEKSG